PSLSVDYLPLSLLSAPCISRPPSTPIAATGTHVPRFVTQDVWASPPLPQQRLHPPPYLQEDQLVEVHTSCRNNLHHPKTCATTQCYSFPLPSCRILVISRSLLRLDLAFRVKHRGSCSVADPL
ncbi:hypothetical protein OTU49_009507, partial [Cherax quadricarinatus]